MIDSEFEFGYMDAGHRVKGKQYALETNDDVTDMYEMYGRKKTRTVVLWAKVGKTKGARKCLYEVSDSVAQSDRAPPTSKKEKRGNSKEKRGNSKEQTAAKEQVPRRSIYQNHVNKMSELEEIIQELEKRQIDGKYTSDQIRVWAHMIQIKKHSSYDKAPDKPFFKVPGSSTKTEGISPAKRITLRSECIDQLEKGVRYPWNNTKNFKILLWVTSRNSNMLYPSGRDNILQSAVQYLNSIPVHDRS